MRAVRVLVGAATVPALLTLAAPAASASTVVAQPQANAMTMGLLGPVGLVAIVLGVVGMVAGVVRQRRKKAAEAAQAQPAPDAVASMLERDVEAAAVRPPGPRAAAETATAAVPVD
ncbi:hypothetical protein HQ32_00498 [Prauserella sp. Am3]|nr:hypothetical protein HQ32_00498 [Prauserella sp. Am3]